MHADRQRRRRLLPALIVASAALLGALAIDSASGASGYPRVAGNPADRLAHLPIDAYSYDYAKGCRKRPQPGMLSLQSWLRRNVRGGSWGIVRCEKLGRGTYSLHAEGRAIDWRLNVHRPAERAAARRLLRLLLATDRAGNRHALARRMGVQEIIWNCSAWWGSPRMKPYSLCYTSAGKRRRIDDTQAHRNHIHIGMSRRGAARRTSFWTRRR